MGKSYSNGSDLNLDDFATYFECLSNGTDLNFVSQDDLPENNFDIGIDELDCPFTEEELGKTISTLIRNKSCGIDNIVADCFIDAKSFMVPYLVTIFNRIFDTGCYPEAWNKGVIVPIFKKGDRNNPRNYRGITLINSLAKLFLLCLRNRLNAWCEQEHIFYRIPVWV